MTNGTWQSGKSSFSKVRDITCCINHGDNLCYKDQVRKNSSNKIRHVTVTSSGHSTSWVDVSSHSKRYNFCKSNEDYIYCEKNPSGDAFTVPFNCGDHYCNAGDCKWHWDRSPAGKSDKCRETAGYGFEFSIDATDGTSQTCTVEVQCQTGEVVNSHAVYQDNTFSAQVWDFDDLHNCDGTIQVGEC